MSSLLKSKPIKEFALSPHKYLFYMVLAPFLKLIHKLKRYFNPLNVTPTVTPTVTPNIIL